ncbi:MAG: OmpH family outer membrane protein [Arsenophonus sp. ET-LJ4-MAG3]
MIKIVRNKEFNVKKILSRVCLGLILFLSINTYAEKIAVINVGEIFQDIAINKAVSKQLEKEFKERANELQNIEKDLQIQSEKLQKNINKLTPKSNEKDLQLFEDKRADFLKKAEQFEQDNQRRQQEERNKILQTIKTATKTIGEKEHYDVIVDMNAILYTKDRSKLKNITDLIIKKVK